MKLHHFDRSPFGWKVRMALAEKGIAYEGVVPENKNDDPAFAELNPFRLTPVLVLDDGRTIYESTVICEYLEEIRPQPALLPRDPYERARIRMIEDTTDQYLYSAIRAVRAAQYEWVPPHLIPKPAAEVDHEALEQARVKVREHLAVLEKQLGAGPWFGGTQFTLADVALATPLASTLPLLGMLPSDSFPGLSAWIERVKARPSWAASAPKVPLSIKK